MKFKELCSVFRHILLHVILEYGTPIATDLADRVRYKIKEFCSVFMHMLLHVILE